MIALGLVLILYAAYWGDFKLQSREIAQKKSQNFDALCQHVNVLVGTMFFPCWLVFGLKYSAGVGFIMAMFFTVINGIIHGIIDWNIWKGYKKHVKENISDYFEKRYELSLEEMNSEFMSQKMYAEDKKFYDTIGLDGFLHVATIVLLYAWFMN